MSAAPACATRARGLPLAGLEVSNHRSLPGARHSPPTNIPNCRSCLSSHAIAGDALSGAGPYSIVSYISATDAIRLLSRLAGRGERDVLESGCHAIHGPVDFAGNVVDLAVRRGDAARHAHPECQRNERRHAAVVLLARRRIRRIRLLLASLQRAFDERMDDLPGGGP